MSFTRTRVLALYARALSILQAYTTRASSNERVLTSYSITCMPGLLRCTIQYPVLR